MENRWEGNDWLGVEKNVKKRDETGFSGEGRNLTCDLPKISFTGKTTSNAQKIFFSTHQKCGGAPLLGFEASQFCQVQMSNDGI